MIADFLGVDSAPELFTIPDGVFAVLMNNKYLPCVTYETKWVLNDPDPRMPVIDLPMTPIQRDIVLKALIASGLGMADPPQPVPPAPRGRLGVFDPSFYTPNLSMFGKLEAYSVLETRAVIRHAEGSAARRRHDSVSTFYDLHGVPQNASVQLPIRFRDWKGDDDVQGGDLSAVCVWTPHFGASVLGGLGLRVKAKIRARNPGHRGRVNASIRAEIQRQAAAHGLSQARTNELLVIAWKESRQRQFETKGVREGLPAQGSSKDDWGVFQLNVLPFPDSASEGYRPIQSKGKTMGWPPTRRQLWDYRANIDAGIRLYKVKLREAEGFLKRIYAAGRRVDPKGIRWFTARDFRLECLERFNGGAYWSHWDAANRRWSRRLPPKSPPYADELIGVLDGLEGTPAVFPADWNAA